MGNPVDLGQGAIPQVFLGWSEETKERLGSPNFDAKMGLSEIERSPRREGGERWI